jgi:group I intron endonuclease
MGYIYKITNIVSGKIYIGETKMADPNNRWKQHISSLTRNKGGCPALKDAMRSYGVDNFKFDIIIICFDEDRLMFEREYIKRYNSIVPNGYNILEGGQMGGGFKGKKHSPETIKKIKETLTLFNQNNPEEKAKSLAKLKESMKNVDIGACMRASEKFNKAVVDGKIGGCAHKTPSLTVKTKISESLKLYFGKNSSDKINIEKHRTAMANATGKTIQRCDKDGNILETYSSIGEAARNVGVGKSALQRVLKGEAYFTCRGWHWRVASA